MPCERGTLVTAADGLAARCVGPWSGDKLDYVRRYLELFALAMNATFPARHYIDLFAGPGRCRFDDDSGEIDGSPILALSVAPPFTKCHFVDRDPAALGALRQRVARRGAEANAEFYQLDANQAVDALRASIPSQALCVAVIDPTGLHLHFDALRRLVEGRRVDLIYLFPEGMAVKRNLDRFREEQTSPLDEVLGSDEWRRRVPVSFPERMGPDQDWEHAGRPIVEILKRQLVTLGYRDVEIGDEVVVRNTRNVPLYYLVFASRASLGHRFWDAVRRVEPSGQIGFKFS
jgi:three-Cys-motif partner protein